MENLLNEYGFETVSEYYDMITDSYINGQKKQCISQIYAMPQDNRRDYVNSIHNGETIAPVEYLTFLINNLI